MDDRKHTRKNGTARRAPNEGERWTTAELRFLKKHYHRMRTADIALRLKRTPGAIYTMVRKLGYSDNVRPWTDTENEILRHYGENGAPMKDILLALPGRSQSAVLSRMRKIRLIRRRWRPDELALLKQYFEAEGVSIISRLPGRSESAIRNQARLLGLESPSIRHQTRWTKQELSLLRRKQHLPLAELSRLFPDRNTSSVQQVRIRLKRHQASQKK
ncbi:hypothetical protein GTGU_04361 [Trabulsiella guamensis ATCC 49490]|uniref:Uncharacterized protein n=1 Tax=Trabulsiella guamensis ATCC 49490 TaxID=1005994 RepID=A0A084ZN58_9ENTR|nr:hypothetical protein [Trabulsiella guamensis]KFB98902.1 hypothetical protein GTGU_04361 [Trabulsiella guamensis ATCC 49490]